MHIVVDRLFFILKLMNMKTSIVSSLMIAAIVIAGCNNEKKEATPEQTIVSDANDAAAINTPVAETQCYSYEGKDTVKLNLVITGMSVTGDLHYHNAEKDDNMGIISGIMKGDTLRADYQFTSEGLSSVREVIFLKTADGFKEGYGPVKDEAGRMIFTDLSKLDFGKSLLLRKGVCK